MMQPAENNTDGVIDERYQKMALNQDRFTI